MGYEILPYAQELDPQIVQLQTHLWSGDAQRNAAYFRWKYLHNPFLDEIVMQLVLFDRRLVAMHGMVGALWEVGSAAERRLVRLEVLREQPALEIAQDHPDRRSARDALVDDVAA